MIKSKRRVKKQGSRRKGSARKRPADITIRRSTGRTEKFNRDRLASTTARSGVPFLMARDIAKKVTRQVRRESQGKKRKTVTARRVRNTIAEELRSRNARATLAYQGRGPAETSAKGTRLPKSKVGSADSDQHRAYRADRDSVIHDKSKYRS